MCRERSLSVGHPHRRASTSMNDEGHCNRDAKLADHAILRNWNATSLTFSRIRSCRSLTLLRGDVRTHSVPHGEMSTKAQAHTAADQAVGFGVSAGRTVSTEQ